MVTGLISRDQSRGGRAALIGLMWCSLSTVWAGDSHDIFIDKYRLHISCEGYGQPTVILDAGLGGSSLEWVAVSKSLREVTRVCVYDRAGYGYSDMGPLPRTSSRIANELYLLLQGGDIPGPFILVGHSFGGFNMQVFSRRYPYLTAGLVLIDASHPEQVERFLAPPLNMLTAPSSRYGIVKFSEPPPPHDLLPSANRREIYQRARRWKTRRTLANELLSFRDSARQVRVSEDLEALPLIVITRGKNDGVDRTKRALVEDLWLDLQSELAGMSPLSAHIVARASGHDIHIEQPELVAFAITLLIDRHRAAVADETNDEMMETSTHQRFAVRGATWLKDDLPVYERLLLAADETACLALTRAGCSANDRD